MIPETVQGRTSAASPLLQGRSSDPAVTMRYNVRIRQIRIMTTICMCGVPRLRSPASIRDSGSNEMERALRTSGTIVDQGAIFLTGKA